MIALFIATREVGPLRMRPIGRKSTWALSVIAGAESGDDVRLELVIWWTTEVANGSRPSDRGRALRAAENSLPLYVACSAKPKWQPWSRSSASAEFRDVGAR